MKGGCNFPMGPLELLDLVGLDTSLAILEALYEEFKDPNYARRADPAPHGAAPSGSAARPASVSTTTSEVGDFRQVPGRSGRMVRWPSATAPG